MDVTEALEPFKAHPLYPMARGAVIAEKRDYGIHAALKKADEIAGAMTDDALLKRIRERDKR